MQTIVYFIQVNVCLVLFYLFYWVLLRKETFHVYNRWYLMGSVLASFVIPITQLEGFKNLFIAQKVVQVKEYISFNWQNMIFIETRKPLFTWQDGLVLLYEVGVLVFFVLFCTNVWKLIQLFRSKENHEAFSFFNTSYVNPETEQSDVIAFHEYVHSKQLHSLDIMLFEFLKIFFWFNPVIWLYQSSLRNLHEYIADEQSAYYQGDTAAYAMLILSKTMGIANVELSNQFFNSSILKERIVMLHKSKSPKMAKLKLGIVLPLFATLLVFSSSKLDANTPIEKMVKEVSFEKPLDLIKEEITTITPLKLSPPVVKLDTLLYDFNQVEHPANFPGGIQEFGKFLARNLKAPEQATKNNVFGKVLVGFVVAKDGNLGNFKILKSVGYGCDEEVIRVLKLSPKWEPATQKGKKVAMRYQIPISFSGDHHQKAIQNDTSLKGTVHVTYYGIEKKTDDNLQEMIKKGTGSNSLPPLCIVDGKPVSQEQMQQISPDRIENISILKDKASYAIYGEKGKNGVILITTKKGEGPIKEGNEQSKVETMSFNTEAGNNMEGISFSAKAEGNKGNQYVLNISKEKTTPLYVLDGKVINSSQVGELEKNKIASINVLKGEKAIEKYGEKGKNGVIEIKSK